MPCFFFFFIFISCAASPPYQSPSFFPIEKEWRVLEEGVELFEGVCSSPKLRFWALRVDTTVPSLEIVVSPKEAVGGVFEKNAMPSSTVSSFVKKYGCIAGVNALPFDPSSAKENERRAIIGLAVADGVKVSETVARYDALVFYKDGRMTIENQGDIEEKGDFASIQNAAGGFYAVLKDGVITEKALSERGSKRHPRTAAGINGKWLYVLVIDGRQRASEGATESETAQILRDLGASDGLAFDGGGSTALAIRNQDGGVQVVNKPIHGFIAGQERAVAVCLGMRKKEKKNL